MSSPFGKHVDCREPRCVDGLIKSPSFGRRDCPSCEALRKRDMAADPVGHAGGVGDAAIQQRRRRPKGWGE